MKFSKLKKLVLFFLVLTIVVYKLHVLYARYGKLFYVQTYLPQPDLPLQIRKEGKLRPWVSGSTEGSSDLPNILCLIMTSPQYHKTRAIHVAVTWARHCARAIFVTSEADPDLKDSYVVQEASSYNELWKKVSRSLSWVYEEKVMSNFDWVLKTDDDTFVFLENLAEALRPYDPNQLVAAGHKLYTWETNEVYLNGGAGYILSKASIALLVKEGLRGNVCERHLDLGTNEDVNMALCLNYVGVTLIDLQDAEGRSQFHIYPPQEEIDPRQQYSWKHLWLKLISVNPYLFGFENITSKPISFHYVNAETMYLLYYFNYIVNSHKGKDTKQNNIKFKKQRGEGSSPKLESEQSALVRMLKNS